MDMDIRSTTRLANGVDMPRLGFGTYRIDEGPDIERSVAAALAAGYRSVDTASMYGNERGVGRAIRESGLPRSDVFLATKVWNDEQGYPRTLAAIERSLDRLGTDHVDLYLVHWPVEKLMAETWRAMEEILDSGRARAIGVCNFLVHHLEELSTTARVPPMVDQFEFHPRLQRPELVDHCLANGIQPEAWAPTMRGRVLSVPELVSLGERHGKTAVQVTLRWILQRGIVAIPKSTHPERIAENSDIFDFELSVEEMSAIDALDDEGRIGPDPNTYARR
jgi:diketogulonate reductase-like aldo/keto reductase